MPRPTFFIVGAPKCGTTALYTWLSEHPQICMSCPKEPQFFAEDIFAHQRNITNLEDYLHCFDSRNTAKEVGEASTCYLASPSAAQQIKTFSPNARIVVMLRNPVDVMYALHSERVLSSMENISDFASALESTEERNWPVGRFRGQRIVRPSYREMARFSAQLQRYLDVFGRERVHVILYEELLASAAETYGRTLDFLGLNHDQREMFEVLNDNRRARSLVLYRFARHPGKAVRRLGHLLLPKGLRKYMSVLINGLNIVREARPALNAELRKRLIRECEPDIFALGTLLGRDLSAWCDD